MAYLSKKTSDIVSNPPGAENLEDITDLPADAPDVRGALVLTPPRYKLEVLKLEATLPSPPTPLATRLASRLVSGILLLIVLCKFVAESDDLKNVLFCVVPNV